MKRTVIILSVLVVALSAGILGCSGNGKGSLIGPVSTNQVGNGNTPGLAQSVSFRIILPESSSKETSGVAPAIRAAGTGTTPEVTFSLILVNAGNAGAPTTTLTKTVPVVAGTAEASFISIPACTCVGDVHIVGGTIASFTDFHGAVDLVVGAQNVIAVAPKGSRLRPDFVAYVIEQVVASPVLFGLAVPNLASRVAQAIVSLDPSKSTAYDDAIALFAKFANVGIVIATGTIDVPNIVGKTRAAAETALAAAGISTTFTSAYSPSIPVGNVISQSPAAYEKIIPGGVVTVVLSLGPEATVDSMTATPLLGGSYWAGQALKLSISIPIASGPVSKVEFFEGASTKIVEFVAPPYEFTIPRISGNKTYTAVVMFASGAVKTFTKTISCKSILERVDVSLADGSVGTLLPDSSTPSFDTVPARAPIFYVTLATEIDVKPDTFSLIAKKMNSGPTVTINAENNGLKIAHSGRALTVSVTSNGQTYGTLKPGNIYQVQLTSGQISIGGNRIALSAQDIPTYQFKTSNTPYFIFDNTTGKINGYVFSSGNMNPALVIPSAIDGVLVTGIGDWAFNNAQLTSILIPNSVTSIGAYAFGSNLLSNVSIPSSVTSIGVEAFRYNQLTQIVIGSGVNIGDRLLTNNQSFRDTYLVSGAGTYIGTQAGTWVKQ